MPYWRQRGLPVVSYEWEWVFGWGAGEFSRDVSDELGEVSPAIERVEEKGQMPHTWG